MKEIMSLFTAASRHLVKAVGAKTLHPTLDLNSAEKFKPFCIVKERRSIWPWIKPKITPTEVTLNDVLKQKIENIDQYLKTFLLVKNYKETPQLQIDGDIGSKIAEDLNIDLSVVDKFEAEINFGDIEKAEVEWENLETQLSKDKFDMTHEIWKEIKGKKRTCISLVAEALSNKGVSSMERSSDEKASASAAVKIPKEVSKVSIDVHGKGDVQKKRHLSYDIPIGTILAYSCIRLAIYDSGNIVMQVQVDQVDGAAPTPGASNSDVGGLASQELTRFLEFEKRKELTNCLLRLLESSVVLGLFEVIAVAEMSASDKLTYSRKFLAIKEEIGVDVKAWIEFLTILGFNVAEDKENVMFPDKDDNGLIKAVAAILEALLDFNNTQLKLLKNCSQARAQELAAVVKCAVNGELNIKASGFDNQQLPEVKLLESFGITYEDTNGVKAFSVKYTDPEGVFQSLYVAIFALLCK